MHMHPTGLQEELPVAAPEEQVVIEPEVPAQEVPDEEELQECPDHQPSSFKRGKPWSISNSTVCNYYYCILFMFDVLSYRSCLIPLLHVYLYSLFT
jgi:hypothetical protein